MTFDNLLELISEYIISINNLEARMIFRRFPGFEDNTMNAVDFFEAIIGTMNTSRKSLITKLYKLITETGIISVDKLKNKYDPGNASLMMRKKRPADSWQKEFEETWDIFYYELVSILYIGSMTGGMKMDK